MMSARMHSANAFSWKQYSYSRNTCTHRGRRVTSVDHQSQRRRLRRWCFGWPAPKCFGSSLGSQRWQEYFPLGTCVRVRSCDHTHDGIGRMPAAFVAMKNNHKIVSAQQHEWLALTPSAVSAVAASRQLGGDTGSSSSPDTGRLKSHRGADRDRPHPLEQATARSPSCPRQMLPARQYRKGRRRERIETHGRPAQPSPRGG